MVMALLGISQMAAQESDYTPFVREGVQWVCYYEHFKSASHMGFEPGKTFFTLELKGDTVIDGKSYKAMHKYSGIGVNTEDDEVIALLREEGKIVYGIIPEGMANESFVMGYGEPWDAVFRAAQDGKEIILYDFEQTESYYSSIFWRNDYNFSYKGLDKVDVGGHPTNRHTFSYRNSDVHFIEGVGYDGHNPGYPLFYLCEIDVTYYLSHVIKDGKIIYKGINYLDVAPLDGRMPMVREGMQWVFEKITVDNGKTTSQYYTYVIDGEDPRGVPSSEEYIPRYKKAKFCRYYDGTTPEGHGGEIVSSLRETQYNGPSVAAIDNTVMDKVARDGRNLMRFIYPFSDDNNAFELYPFDHEYPQENVSTYIARQLAPRILTADNFKLIEPVEIDGYSCNRYAYFDENGQVQCYIIEGIGIDSRDMGDLLAPFTRKPDPEADYQEYCGLSHVIMDGRIIYKGMRYDPDRLQAMEYDVNGDMAVDISDVVALIDMLLKPENPQITHADVNSSGSIEISDVTTLIDYILSH